MQTVRLIPFATSFRIIGNPWFNIFGIWIKFLVDSKKCDNNHGFVGDEKEDTEEQVVEWSEAFILGLIVCISIFFK